MDGVSAGEGETPAEPPRIGSPTLPSGRQPRVAVMVLRDVAARREARPPSRPRPSGLCNPNRELCRSWLRCRGVCSHRIRDLLHGCRDLGGEGHQVL